MPAAPAEGRQRRRETTGTGPGVPAGEIARTPGRSRRQRAEGDPREAELCHLLKSRGEVAQPGRLLGKAVSLHVRSALPDLENGLNDIIDVALSVDPAWNRKPHQLHRCRGFLSAFRIALPEHHRSDLDPTDSCLSVQLHHQSLAGKLERGDLGEEGCRVDIDRVTAGRLHDGNPGLGNVLSQIRGRADSVKEIVLVQGLMQPNSYGVEVAAGHPAV